MESSEVSKLFSVKQVLIDDECHKDELGHVNKVGANSVGRLLGDRIPQLKCLRKHLSLHYKHQNSQTPKQPADILVMKLEGLQETVNSEMVAYLDIVQKKFLHEEVAAGVENKTDYLKDLKMIENKDMSVEMREEAESRVKKEVLRQGVWIGNGDLLTCKMFYVAKSLRYSLSLYSKYKDIIIQATQCNCSRTPGLLGNISSPTLSSQDGQGLPGL